MQEIINYIKDLIFNMGALAPFLACFLILIESMIPILPLCTFITINFIVFGNLIGFIISWLFTLIGCYISFILVKKGINTNYKKGKFKIIVDKMLTTIRGISLSKLTMLLAIPFTPAFAINIACGLAKTDNKKFLISLLIGKIFMVYFWGYIGKSLVESFADPYTIIKVIILIIIAYLLSLIVNKFTKVK